jgi:hypothetical protein
MDYLYLYLIEISEGIRVLSFMLFFGFFVVFICGIAYMVDSREKIAKLTVKLTASAFLLAVFFALIVIAIPDKKDLATIYLLPKIENNENIPEGIVKHIEDKYFPQNKK